ncbi:unnamed protein product [Closterium sp. NIES-53]
MTYVQLKPPPPPRAESTTHGPPGATECAAGPGHRQHLHDHHRRRHLLDHPNPCCRRVRRHPLHYLRPGHLPSRCRHHPHRCYLLLQSCHHHHRHYLPHLRLPRCHLHLPCPLCPCRCGARSKQTLSRPSQH